MLVAAPQTDEIGPLPSWALLDGADLVGAAAPPAAAGEAVEPEPSFLDAPARGPGRAIRLGVLFSLLFHGAALGLGLVNLYLEPPLEAGAEESIAVEIIETSSVSSNAAATAVQSDASAAMLSAGTPEALPPVTAETLEPTAPENAAEPPPRLEPVPDDPPPEPVAAVAPPPAQAAPLEPLAPVETAKPVAPAAVEPLLSAAADPAAPSLETAPPPAAEPVAPAALAEPVAPLAALRPVETREAAEAPPETLEPVSDTPPAPVPATRTVAQRQEPTYPQRPKAEPPKKKPAPQAQEAPQKKKPKPAPSGNGGADEADAQASAASNASKGSSAGAGGSADKYPGKVLAKLRRALRYPRNAGGATGEVSVAFTVSAGGSVSGIRVVGSSGNAALDQAAIATVQRAAPFPPIPAEAGRSSWTFTMPLGFVR